MNKEVKAKLQMYVDDDKIDLAKKDEDYFVRLEAYHQYGYTKEAFKDKSSTIRLNAFEKLGYTKESLKDECWKIRIKAGVKIGFTKEALSDEHKQVELAARRYFYNLYKNKDFKIIAKTEKAKKLKVNNYEFFLPLFCFYKCTNKLTKQGEKFFVEKLEEKENLITLNAKKLSKSDKATRVEITVDNDEKLRVWIPNSSLFACDFKKRSITISLVFYKNLLLKNNQKLLSKKYESQIKRNHLR